MIKFFDVNHWLDCSNYRLSSSLCDRSEKEQGIISLRQKLEDNDITGVMITSKLALEYDWNIGNERLLESKLSQHIDNLYYSYVLSPDAYFTFDFEEYLKTAFENKVRLFRAFPKRQLFVNA